MLWELWGCCFWLKMDFLNLPAPGHALGLCEHPCVWAWHFPPPLLGHLSASWFLSAVFSPLPARKHLAHLPEGCH